jgi:hypothetical protein
LILRLVFWLLAAVGLAGGGTFERALERPVEERAGYRVLQGDFHMHTRFSDGVVSPCDLVLLGRSRGLDVIAVTEHNSVFPSQLARACARFLDGAPIVVTGEEITTLHVHLLALGVEADVDARAPLRDVIDAVHAQGGVVLAAHPTKRYHDRLSVICDRIDGIEVVHPLAYRGEGGIGRWHDMAAFARGPCGDDKAMIGNSDYHGGSVLGLVRTWVFVTEPSASGVLEAIRDARTVTYAPDGSAFGPPDLVASLAAAPLAERPTEYGYRSSGRLDWLTRSAGFLGFLGLFVFGWRPRRK